MNVGIPKERKRDERRVALTPKQAETLISRGHRVFVETQAGLAAGYADCDYEKAGTEIVSQNEIYQKATLIVKVKCPLQSEYKFYNPGHILFAYLHFDENISRDNIQRIIDRNLTAIAYEWVQVNGRLPLLEPMSRLTGAVFARKAMSLLMEAKGVLGGSYLPNWPAAKAMVIGAGNIGCSAINVLARNNFDLIVVDKHPETLRLRLSRYLPAEVKPKIKVIHFNENSPLQSVKALRQQLSFCDIIVSAAVRRPTLPKDKCEYLICRQDLKNMQKKSVICDATACDKDFIESCISSESLTDYYFEQDILHYNCDHIPALVPSTATKLLTEATFPYTLMLADGSEDVLRDNPALSGAVMCRRGFCTHNISARKKNLTYKPLEFLTEKSDVPA